MNLFLWIPKIVPCLLVAVTVLISCNLLRCVQLSAACVVEQDDEDAVESQDINQDTAPKTREQIEFDATLAILKRHQIEPTNESVVAFLKSLQPGHPDQELKLERARELIEQLGDSDHKVRSKATNELFRMFQLPVDAIQAAAESEDLEVSLRAKEIIARNRNPAREDSLSGVIEAVATMVCFKQLNGTNEELFNVIPLVSNDFINDKRTLAAIRTAFLFTANQNGLDRIRNGLQCENVEQRMVSLLAISHLLKSESVSELQMMLNDSSVLVQIEAARELANLGNREILVKLVDLLNAEDVNVRTRANQLLQSYTGQNFNFMAYSKEEERLVNAKMWGDWVETQGDTAELFFPLREVNFEIGLILITDYTSGKVQEVDMDGQKTWEITVSHPWGVQGLPNGHRVISTYQPSALIEYDESGEEVWRIDNVPGNAMGIHRLENGNTLVACSTTNQVIEYKKNGEIEWEATTESRCCDVQRLDDGNTLVTLIEGGKVIELDREGEVVWEIAVAGKPLTAERNVDGSTMVACNDEAKAIEYDREGNVTREYDVEGKCSAARVLGNGTLLLTSNTKATLIKPDGSVIWEVEGFNLCYGANNY